MSFNVLHVLFWRTLDVLVTGGFYKCEIIHAITIEWDPLIWVGFNIWDWVNYAFGLFEKQEKSNAQQYALITLRNTTISSKKYDALIRLSIKWPIKAAHCYGNICKTTATKIASLLKCHYSSDDNIRQHTITLFCYICPNKDQLL